MLTPLDSSCIASVDYSSTETLDVVFTTGAVYRYFGVPGAVVHALLSAASKGAFFNLGIKPHFRFERLSP